MTSFIKALMIGVIFFALLSGCNRLGKPDVRKEQINDELTPDYFGWRWDFKW